MSEQTKITYEKAKLDRKVHAWKEIHKNEQKYGHEVAIFLYEHYSIIKKMKENPLHKRLIDSLLACIRIAKERESAEYVYELFKRTIYERFYIN